MSDDVGPHLTSDDDDDTSTDLMTFCIQLVHQSQWKSRRRFTCGSSVEIPLCEFISEEFEVNKDMLDTDMMLYNTSYCAAHRSVTLPEAFTGIVLLGYIQTTYILGM